MNPQYQEEEKIAVRNESLSLAIKTLTTNRYESSIARKSYVRDIKKHLQLKGTIYDKKISSFLSDEEIDRWEKFYESIIKKKTAGELRVAYLSGPSPENDIKVLVDNGILPENIWAFESDNKMYDAAIMSALESEFPFVKIYKGRIENYLKVLPFKFDIIYLDFCSSIAGEKTMSVIRDIFLYQKLETLGILITNFALPNSNPRNKEFNKNINTLAANYLYPKNFTEAYTNLGGGFQESADVSGIERDEFFKIASRNKRTFYSQFITRILYDLPSVIIPYQRLANDENLYKLFFKNFTSASFDNDYHEDLICSPSENSIVWGLSQFMIDDESFSKFFNKFRKQLSIYSDENKLLEQLELVNYFISEGAQNELHSDKLEIIRRRWNATQKYIFCDMFLFHQLKDVLIGQLTSPYYYNVDKTRRWAYKARETEMFMDLIVYDECRYVFDWMPTLDMFESGVDDWNRQLALRFAMDSISKQRRWYNDEFFSGTAVVDQRTRTFEAKELKRRKLVKFST
jgi:hypothetical protein